MLYLRVVLFDLGVPASYSLGRLVRFSMRIFYALRVFISALTLFGGERTGGNYLFSFLSICYCGYLISAGNWDTGAVTSLREVLGVGNAGGRLCGGKLVSADNLLCWILAGSGRCSSVSGLGTSMTSSFFLSVAFT